MIVHNFKTCANCDCLFRYEGNEFGLSNVYNRPIEPWQFIEGKTNSLIWIVSINQAFNEGKRDLDSLFPKKNKQVFWDVKKNDPDLRTEEGLVQSFDTYKIEGENGYDYYRTFYDISPTLYNWLGEEYGAANTEVIRCGTVFHDPIAYIGKKFDDIVPKDESERKSLERDWDKITESVRKNCSEHFRKLLLSDKISIPKLIVSNGKPSNDTLREIFFDDLSNDEKSLQLKEVAVEKKEYMPFYRGKYQKYDSIHEVTVVQMPFMGREYSKLKRRTFGLLIDSLIRELKLEEIRERFLTNKNI